MWILYLLMLPFGIGLAFYFRYFFKRMAEAFGADTKKKAVNIPIWLLAAALGLLSLNILRFGAIIILHVFVFAVALQLVNFIVKKCGGGSGLWKKIYGSGVIPIALAAIMLTAGYVNMHSVVRTDYTVYTDKAIREEGYRVVLIADVHYGVSIGDEELYTKCDEISALNADLVILCGDIVDSGTSAEGMETVFDALGKIKSKQGVFYVYGNHDRPYSHGGAFTEKQLTDTIEANGIRILSDEVAAIDEGLLLVGREDRGYSVGSVKRKSIDELLENESKDAFVLTLDHQPTEYAENGSAGTDLLLSGHTHGGQLLPLNIIFELFDINDAVYGYTQIDEDTAAIVTSGFAGWSYPVKTAAPAEYVVIDIKGR